MTNAHIQQAIDWHNEKAANLPAGYSLGVLDTSKPPIITELSKGWNLIGNTSGQIWKSNYFNIPFTGALNMYTFDDIFGNGIIKNVQGQFWNSQFSHTFAVYPGQAVMAYVSNDPASDAAGDPDYFHYKINPAPVKNWPAMNLSLQFQRAGVQSGIECRLYEGWNFITYTGHEPVDNSNVTDVLQNAMQLSIPSDSYVPIGPDVIEGLTGIGYNQNNDEGVDSFAQTFETIDITASDMLTVMKEVNGMFWSHEFSMIGLTPGRGYLLFVNNNTIPEDGILTINFQRNE